MVNYIFIHLLVHSFYRQNSKMVDFLSMFTLLYESLNKTEIWSVSLYTKILSHYFFLQMYNFLNQKKNRQKHMSLQSEMEISTIIYNKEIYVKLNEMEIDWSKFEKKKIPFCSHKIV